LHNSFVDACTVNAFKARIDKFRQHQVVKFDFTADLTVQLSPRSFSTLHELREDSDEKLGFFLAGTGNRSQELIKRYCSFMTVDNNDAGIMMRT